MSDLGAGPELLFWSSFLDDIESVRVASVERARSMFRELHPDTEIPKKLATKKLLALVRDLAPELAPFVDLADATLAVEHQAILNLRSCLRRHLLGPWIRATVGIGEKQGARLIAALTGESGSITYNDKEGRPRRGPAEQWKYGGLAPGQRNRKGVKSNFNPEVKKWAFLIAESCMKHRRSPYRADYDRARANWADRATTDLHKHNHALRIVAKTMLKDLFLEARRVGA